MEFLASFPIYALQSVHGLENNLLGVPHPDTGQKVVFVFTEENEAHRFADEWGSCTVVTLAENPEAFKRALQQMQNEVIAFDPVIHERELHVKFQSLVSSLR